MASATPMTPSASSQTPSTEKEAGNSHEDIGPADACGKTSAWRRRRWILPTVLSLLVVIALALGLGLGIGLRKRNGATVLASTSVNWNGEPLAFVPREKLVDPAHFSLSSTFDRHAPPQVREYNWTVSRVLSNPAGVTKPMLVVNNLSPGPTIEANLGDTILVHVHNDLGNATTAIHWHGQNQNGTNFMDGTLGVTDCGIAPGASRTYNWTVQNVGDYWWHSHAAGQYSDGLVGALILHSPNETYSFATPTAPSSANNNTYDGDLVVLVSDTWHSPSAQWLATYLTKPGQADGSFEGAEPVPDSGLVAGYGTGTCLGLPAGTACDGGSYFNFTVDSNKRYRFRVINSGSIATINFAIDSHPLLLITADGTEIQPQNVTNFDVQVAQRYSVLVETKQPSGAFFIRATLTDDMLAYDNPALNKDQRAVLRYSTAAAAAPTADAAPELPGNYTPFDQFSLSPLQAMNPPPSTKQEQLVINFGYSQESDFRAFFNGTSWTPDMNGTTTLVKAFSSAGTYSPPVSQLILQHEEIAVVDLIISNEDEGMHPIHLHGYTPYVLGTGSGRFAPSKLDLSKTFVNPMRRDVWSVPVYGWIAVRIVTDNPGLWLLHCHLVAHMEAGLAAQVLVQPSKIRQFAEAQVTDGCPAVSAFAATHPSAM